MPLARQKPKKGARPPGLLPDVGAQAVPSPRSALEGVEELLAQLAHSKTEYAKAYLNARLEGTEISEGRKSTTDDARMWARRNLAERGVPDAETIRWRLTLLLGAPQVDGD